MITIIMMAADRARLRAPLLVAFGSAWSAPRKAGSQGKAQGA